jgi:glycosyltransferase involved in cell wall biosynthesis
MSAYHEFHVIYGHDGTPDLREMDDWIKAHPYENIHYYPVTIPDGRYANFTKWLYRHEKYIGFYLMYKLWHKEAYYTALNIKSRVGIDVIHYLNPIGFKEPGECWRIKDIPYIWGPVQGVENWPISLYRAITIKGKIEALYRLIAHNAVLVGSIKVRRAVKRADYIFGATPRTLKQFNVIYGKKLDYLPENGLMKMNVTKPIYRVEGEPLQLIWAGKFEDRKCVHLLLAALSLIKEGNWNLTLCGTGLLEGKVKQFIAKEQIDHKVCLKGKISREEVQQCFKKAHLHVISSMSEATTTVLLESMSWGVPTLTLDHCGMSGVVCEKCGIKIPIKSYHQVVHDMASAIKNLIDQPSKVKDLSEGVIECSRQYMWDNRAERFNRAYNSIVAKK